jgi:class 3 adenylate cyclase
MTKLKTKFYVYILLPVFLVITLAGVISFLVARHIVLEQLWELGQSLLQQTADEVDSTFGTGVQTLSILTIHEGFVPSSEKDLQNFFRELRDRLPVEAILLISLDGRLIAGVEDSKIPADYQPVFEKWFTDALDSSEPVIGPPTVSPFTSQPVITVANRVLDKHGTPTGVMAYTVPLNRVSCHTAGMCPLERSNEAIFSIFVRDGAFLTHTDKNLVGHKLGESNDDLHIRMRQALGEDKPSWCGIGYVGGEQYFGGFRKSRYGQVYVGLEIPLAVGLRPVMALGASYLGLGVACLILLPLILKILAKRLVKPIRILSEATAKFGRGEYDQVLPVTNKDELWDLVDAFNKMSAGVRQRDFIRNTFGRYVPPEIVDQVLESEDGLKLGGESREITILMSDLRGFSAQTADMPPDRVLLMLNRYLGRMVEILLDHKAVIDEMEGDGILAFFGAPMVMTDHPARAVACALAMQGAMAEINAQNEVDGLPHLEMGIGINTGQVVVGNIGSEKRTKYGIVGSAVNFTGRIESYSLGDQILISESTFARVAGILEVRDVLSVEMKGFRGKVQLYDVRGISGPFNVSLKDTFDVPLPVPHKIPVSVRAIVRKIIKPARISAFITHLSETSVVIETSEHLDEISEIRIDLVDELLAGMAGESFARVLSTERSGDLDIWRARFTFLSPEARRILRTLFSRT